MFLIKCISYDVISIIQPSKLTRHCTRKKSSSNKLRLGSYYSPLLTFFFVLPKKNCRFLQLLCEISHGSFRESGCRIDLNVTLILVSRTLWQWQLLCYSYLRKGLSISVSKEMSKGLILALTSWHREGLTFLFFVDCVNLWKV